LKKERAIYNVDGTINKQGNVTHYCILFVIRGKEEHKEVFFVTDLGQDCIILGYSWLMDFEPWIRWKEGTIEGPEVQIETIPARWRRIYTNKEGLAVNSSTFKPTSFASCWSKGSLLLGGLAMDTPQEPMWKCYRFDFFLFPTQPDTFQIGTYVQQEPNIMLT
jgi:hypothetical protein